MYDTPNQRMVVYGHRVSIYGGGGMDVGSVGITSSQISNHDPKRDITLQYQLLSILMLIQSLVMVTTVAILSLMMVNHMMVLISMIILQPVWP
jgi:hypothetical protein